MRWRDTSLSDIDRVEAMYHHIKVDIAAQPIIDDFYSEVEEAFEMAKELRGALESEGVDIVPLGELV